MHRRAAINQFFIAALATLLLSVAPAVAFAAGSTSSADQVRLLKIAAEEQVGASDTNPVHIAATVDYQVNSVPRGLLVLFVLEDNALTATVDSSEGQKVSEGTGEAQLTTVYKPSSPGKHSLTLVAGLFNDSKQLLAWTRTPQFSLNAIPGRAEFENALAAYNAGHYSTAIDGFTAAINQAPNVGLYYCWRADTQVHLAQYGAAVADYSRALDLNPKDRGCLLGRGIAYLWSGDQGKAITDLSTVIDQSATADRWTAWALRARGIAYADLGNYSDAISNYQAYLSVVPNAGDQSEIKSWISELQSAQTSQNNATQNSG